MERFQEDGSSGYFCLKQDETFDPFETEEESGEASHQNVLHRLSISKRAARRLIQRALVLVGRDRTVRQHIREAQVKMLWVLADWQFGWTVRLHRGKVLFDRRPARKPHLTLTWPSAKDFFKDIDEGRTVDATLQLEGDLQLRRYSEVILRTFSRLLGQVMRHPFDDAGNPLA